MIDRETIIRDYAPDDDFSVLYRFHGPDAAGVECVEARIVITLSQPGAETVRTGLGFDKNREAAAETALREACRLAWPGIVEEMSELEGRLLSMEATGIDTTELRRLRVRWLRANAGRITETAAAIMSDDDWTEDASRFARHVFMRRSVFVDGHWKGAVRIYCPVELVGALVRIMGYFGALEPRTEEVEEDVGEDVVCLTSRGYWAHGF